MLRIAIASALIAIAAPALAAERAHNPQQITEALKAGCAVRHVHSPAGKPVQQSAIVHCKRATNVETANRMSLSGKARETGMD